MLNHIFLSYLLRMIYNSLILPHMNYSLLAWGANYCHSIELLRKKVVRVIHFKSPLAHMEPILTLSDPAYFRQLTIRGGGGGFKSPPPPYDLENCFVNLHHIIQVDFTRCFSHDSIRIFQKFTILTLLKRFQNKK